MPGGLSQSGRIGAVREETQQTNAAARLLHPRTRGSLTCSFLDRVRFCSLPGAATTPALPLQASSGSASAIADPVGETCIRGRSGISRPPTTVLECAEGAFDASERSTAELGARGASQESGGCKHQSSSHHAEGRTAGVGQFQPRDGTSAVRLLPWRNDRRSRVRAGDCIPRIAITRTAGPGRSLRGRGTNRCRR